LTPGKDPIPWQQKIMVTFYPVVEIATVITLILVTLKIRIHRKKFTPVTAASVTADVEKQNLSRHQSYITFSFFTDALTNLFWFAYGKSSLPAMMFVSIAAVNFSGASHFTTIHV
jgi:hypothetical protein